MKTITSSYHGPWSLIIHRYCVNNLLAMFWLKPTGFSAFLATKNILFDIFEYGIQFLPFDLNQRTFRLSSMISSKKLGERQTDRQRQTDRDRDRQTETETDRQTETETDRQTETDTDTDTQTERNRDRDTERLKERG